MKKFAIFLIFVIFAAMIGIGYVYFIASVDIVSYGCMAVEASTQEELFGQLKSGLKDGTFSGILYQTDPELTSSGDYVFYTYTVRLRNNTFLTADMVEMQVTMKEGDVLQIGDNTPKALRSRQTGDIQATILTDRSTNNVRELTITYYMWGMPFSSRTVYGQ